jgi:hypothetical protein
MYGARKEMNSTDRRELEIYVDLIHEDVLVRLSYPVGEVAKRKMINCRPVRLRKPINMDWSRVN